MRREGSLAEFVGEVLGTGTFERPRKVMHDDKTKLYVWEVGSRRTRFECVPLVSFGLVVIEPVG
jgi:hypothetical protein